MNGGPGSIEEVRSQAPALRHVVAGSLEDEGTTAGYRPPDVSGDDPFEEYQVPLAILALHQGLGRLLRHRLDRGVLAVLDPRLRTMGYGRRFLDSLPPAPVTSDPADIVRFFAS